jgi:hypothetical protein
VSDLYTQNLNPPAWQIWLRNGLTAVFLAYCVKQSLNVFGYSHGLTDIMMFTGSAVCLLGFWLAIGIRQRMHGVIGGLYRTGVLMIGEPDLAKLHEHLEATAVRFAHRGAIIIGIAEVAAIVSGKLLVPWLIYREPLIGDSNSGLTIAGGDGILFIGLLSVGAVAGPFVGWLLGHLAGYSNLPEAVRQSGGELRLQPSARDRMGGLQPLVSFLRRQAALTLLPVAWIGIWLVLTAFGPFIGQYGSWRCPFFMLLGIAVLYSAQGFLRPVQVLARLLDEIAAFAHEQNDGEMEQEISNVRSRVWPRPISFYVIVISLLVAILVAGIPLGPLSFLFGPAPS